MLILRNVSVSRREAAVLMAALQESRTAIVGVDNVSPYIVDLASAKIERPRSPCRGILNLSASPTFRFAAVTRSLDTSNGVAGSTLSIIDTTTGAIVGEHKHAGQINLPCWSADERFIAATTGGGRPDLSRTGILLFSLSSKGLILLRQASFEGDGPGDDRLAVLGPDLVVYERGLKLWRTDLTSGHSMLLGDGFSPQMSAGKLALSDGGDLYAQELGSGRRRQLASLLEAMGWRLLSPDGRFVVFSGPWGGLLHDGLGVLVKSLSNQHVLRVIPVELRGPGSCSTGATSDRRRMVLESLAE